MRQTAACTALIALLLGSTQPSHARVSLLCQISLSQSGTWLQPRTESVEMFGGEESSWLEHLDLEPMSHRTYALLRYGAESGIVLLDDKVPPQGNSFGYQDLYRLYYSTLAQTASEVYTCRGRRWSITARTRDGWVDSRLGR